jgi:hypothetical protein
MTIHVAIVSEHGTLLDEVRGFAHGLGCTFAAPPADGTVAFAMPSSAETLLNVLTFVVLSATKLGLNPSEPLCHVTYQEGNATSTVTLSIRLEGFDIGASARRAVTPPAGG